MLFAEEAFRIQGAVFEVSRQMGTGFLEAVYQECLAIEFADQGIPFLASPPLALAYKGQPLTQFYRPDFVCFESIIVELKAARELAPEHRAQVLNYLRATGLRLGLLVNFGCAPKARAERLVL
jgi:GxxExxY protein